MLHKPQLVAVGNGDLTALLPGPPVPGPYSSPLPPLGVPSLVWFCLNRLYLTPDQIHVLPTRLYYRNELNDLDLLNLDPRLWATLVQIYDNLPQKLSTYKLPLNDTHLPLLQRIPCTPRFSLVTVLELSTCSTLDDDTVSHLKILHSLTAFDASNTSLTAYGIKALASTLQLADEDPHLPYRGPWPLRILSLRGCRSITNQALPHLAKFPLLSVIDLRNTRCTSQPSLSDGFTRNGPSLLYHPTTLSQSLSYLLEVCPDLYSSPNPYTLLINTLDHKPSQLRPPPSGPVHQDNVVVTLSSNSKLRISNAVRLERLQQAREEQERKLMLGALDANIDPYLLSSRPAPRPQRPYVSAFPRATDITHGRAIAAHAHDPSPSMSRRKVREPPPVKSTVNKPSVVPNSRPAWVNPTDEPFMLYRDPPPWSALADALHMMRSQDARRREALKAAVALRNSDFASIDRTKRKGAQVKQQLENLVMKRKQMHEDFGLPQPKPKPRPMPLATRPPAAVNPFKRKADTGRPHDDAEVPIASTSGGSTSCGKGLVPISLVPTPVFTQELLDVSAKENKKAAAAMAEKGSGQLPLSKSARRSSLPASTSKRKQPRKSEPSLKKPGGFDWQKWGKGGT